MVKEPKICVYVWLLFAVAVIVSVLYACLCGRDVHDNGGGADAIRSELVTAGGKLTEQASTITDAIGTATEIERAAGEVLEIERGDAELLADCRRILEGVRSRGETEASH